MNGRDTLLKLSETLLLSAWHRPCGMRAPKRASLLIIALALLLCMQLAVMPTSGAEERHEAPCLGNGDSHASMTEGSTRWIVADEVVTDVNCAAGESEFPAVLRGRVGGREAAEGPVERNWHVPCVQGLEGDCPAWEGRYPEEVQSGDTAGGRGTQTIAASPTGDVVYRTARFMRDNLNPASPTITGVVVMAYSVDGGQVLWTFELADEERGTLSPGPWGVYLAVDAMGQRVFAVHEARSDPYTGVLAIALDARTGEQLWVTRVDPAGTSAHSLPTGAAVSSGDNTLFISAWVGHTGGFNSGYPGVVALDAVTGEVVWNTRHIHEWESRPGHSTIAVAPVSVTTTGGVSVEREHVFVSGAHWTGFPGGWDGWTRAYDGATGELLWHSMLRGPREVDDGIFALAAGVGSDGITRVYASGYVDNGAFGDSITVAYDGATGELLWESRYGVPRPDGDLDVVQSSVLSRDRATLITTGYLFPVVPPGSNLSVGGLLDARVALTTALDTKTGAVRWQTQHGLGSTDGFDVAVAPDDRRVFTLATNYRSRQAQIVAYDTDSGAQVGYASHRAACAQSYIAWGVRVLGNSNRLAVASNCLVPVARGGTAAAYAEQAVTVLFDFDG